MGEGSLYRAPLFEKLNGLLGEERFAEALPDVFHSLVGRVEHVFTIETVVAQFVVDNLVGREIHHVVHLLCQLVGSQKQCSLRQLTAVKAVLGIADGAYGDDDTNRGINLPKHRDRLTQIVSTLVNAQLALGEQPLRTFPAIVHYLARLVEDVDMIGAEREHSRLRGFVGCAKLPGPSLHGVHDACRVVHYAVWIDRSAKLVLHKSTSYVVGKARAYKKHTLARFDSERRERNVYWCTKLHIVISSVRLFHSCVSSFRRIRLLQ